MASYHYLVVKYLSDEVRKEPINIGIIMHSTSGGKVYSKFVTSYNQLLIRAPDANIDLIEHFTEHTASLASMSADYLAQLSSKFRHQIQFSDVLGTITDSPEIEINELYERFISIKGLSKMEVRELMKAKKAIPKQMNNELRKLVLSYAIEGSTSTIANSREFMHQIESSENLKVLINSYQKSLFIESKRGERSSRRRPKA